MDDDFYKDDERKENFRRQIAESNAYHQKKLKSPEEVSKRLNYQDKTRGDPNSPFKGCGRRVGSTNPPPPPPRRTQQPQQKSINHNINHAPKPRPSNHIPMQNQQQPHPKPPSNHLIQHDTPSSESQQTSFKGVGHFVGSSKPNKNQMNDILAPQRASYHNQQGVEMRTWHNLLNDPMDENQTKCFSLINETRVRNNKQPLAFSRACTARVQEQVQKVCSNEIKIEEFSNDLKQRAELIPRCKKANEVVASVSKIEQKTQVKKTVTTVKTNSKPLSTVKSNSIAKPTTAVRSNANVKSNSVAKPPVTAKPPSKPPLNHANLNTRKTQSNAAKPADLVKRIFDKWMEKPSMRSTILGNYQVIGIVFADNEDGSSLVGAAIFANIT